MSLILDALRKARESRAPTTPDPYLIVGGKRSSHQRVFTRKFTLSLLVGSATLGIALWFILSPRALPDRPIPSGEAIKQVQAVQVQAVETRPAEQAQPVDQSKLAETPLGQPQQGQIQAFSQSGHQPTIESTAELDSRPHRTPPSEQPEVVESPPKKTSKPTPEKAAFSPPMAKEAKISRIPKTDDIEATTRSRDDKASDGRPAAVAEGTSTPKIPPEEIAISELQERKQVEQERFHFQQALSYHKNKQLQKALLEYQNVLELNPSNTQARNNLGLVYKDMGDLDRAAAEYIKLIALEPNNAKAYNNLGTIYYLQGRLQEAVQEFTKALAMDERNLESYVNLALSYKKQGQKREAIQALQKVLSIDPQMAEAHYNLALLMEEMGDISATLVHFQKFVDLSAGRHLSLVEEVRRHIQELSSKKQRQILLK